MRRLSLPLLLLFSLSATCAIGAPLAQVLQQFDRDSHGDLRAVVVLRDGALVAERHYNGQAQDSLHDMRAAGKSVTARGDRRGGPLRRSLWLFLVRQNV